MSLGTELSRPPYFPTVLLVDDDKACTDVWREKFQEDTSVGVVVANSLDEGRRLLEDQSIPIDGVVSDFRFEVGRGDPTGELLNGLDLLGFASRVRPRARRYVLSFYAERESFLREIKEKELQVARVFRKLYYFPEGELLPWHEVENDLLVERLPKDIDTKSATYFQNLKLPMRTYLQDLPGGDLIVTKPIEILCVKEDDGQVRASALSLGLISDGFGESVGEAIDHLGGLIGEQFRWFSEIDADKFIDYAARVRERLLDHIAHRDAT